MFGICLFPLKQIEKTRLVEVGYRRGPQEACKLEQPSFAESHKAPPMSCQISALSVSNHLLFWMYAFCRHDGQLVQVVGL